MHKPLKYLQKNNILSYPRLDTVLMVEDTIKDLSGEHKVAIWKKLPKKMKYQTFCTVIDYLLYSGKIGIDKENKLCWIHDPKLTRYYYNRKDLNPKK